MILLSTTEIDFTGCFEALIIELADFLNLILPDLNGFTTVPDTFWLPFFKDSRNIGLSAKKIAKGMGVDLGNEFEERLDTLRSNPASVIKESE